MRVSTSRAFSSCRSLASRAWATPRWRAADQARVDPPHRLPVEIRQERQGVPKGIALEALLDLGDVGVVDHPPPVGFLLPQAALEGEHVRDIRPGVGDHFDNAGVDLRMEPVAPGVPPLGIRLRRYDAPQQVRRGEDPAATARRDAGPVQAPVQFVLIPNQGHPVQARPQGRHGPGVAVGHDGNAVQELYGDGLESGKVRRIEPGFHVRQLLLGDIELGGLQVL